MVERGRGIERVIVAGAGPAALSVARHLAELGLAVEIHAPTPRAPWPASFGVWSPSVQGVDWGDAVTACFETPRVVSQKGRLFELGNSYLRLDTPRLQRNLLAQAEQAGVRFVKRTHNARTLISTDTRLAIDATGQGLRDKEARIDAFQTAYGLWIDVPSRSSLAHPMTLMDFRGADQKTPSFLYAMKESSSGGVDRLFVQETVLASKKPASLEGLKSRLLARLETLGLSAVERISEERCVIPLGRELPNSFESTVRFGAAAGMVHPATGYQLATCLSFAEPVSQAIFQSRSLGTKAASEAALTAMWPKDRQRSWQLYRWSAFALTEMNQREMGEFSEAFFSMPTESWFGFMQGSLTPPQLLGVLARVFSHSSVRLKLRLLRSSGSRGVSLSRLLLAS